LCRSLCQAGAYLPNKLSLWTISQRHNTSDDGLASRPDHSWVTAVASLPGGAPVNFAMGFLMSARNAFSSVKIKQISMRPLTQDDVDAAHSLSVAVGWPHRAADWRAVLAVGEGLCAHDAVGRLAGTAMWWPMGKKVAAIGMVIVAPHAQEQGLGRRLMHAVFAAAQRQTLTLNATTAGESLYVSEGFRPIGTIRQYQGIARPVVLPDAAAFPVRAATQPDGAAIAALDRAALGYDRASILQTLTRDAEGLVHERDGRLVGFSYCRSFGRGAVIGPIIAADETIALALVAPFLSRHGGSFLRADIPEDAPALARLLEDGGLFPAGHATTMIRGRKSRLSGKARVFGLINQGIG
jgi:ribosomal protein S18 acetylase RimI-like enzyme